jgi:hypothetical protein
MKYDPPSPLHSEAHDITLHFCSRSCCQSSGPSISFALSVYSFFLYPDYGLLSDNVTMCSSRRGLYKETLHSIQVNFKWLCDTRKGTIQIIKWSFIYTLSSNKLVVSVKQNLLCIFVRGSQLKLWSASKDTDPNKNYALYGNPHILHVYVLFL